MASINVTKTKNDRSFYTILFWLMGGVLLTGGAILTSILVQTPLGQPVTAFLKQAFALNSVQTMWYITRAAGLTGYLLLWLSVVWGLAVSSKILDSLLHRTFIYDFHQFISLLAIGFIVLHILVLLFDSYLPYSLAQILVPFLSPYRPLWVGVGILAFYLVLLVTVTFYLRGRIGMSAFRAIHTLSLVAYLGTVIHSFFAGTDSSLIMVMLLYASTFLVVVFLLAYWLVMLGLKNHAKARAPISGEKRPTISTSAKYTR